MDLNLRGLCHLQLGALQARKNSVHRGRDDIRISPYAINGLVIIHAQLHVGHRLGIGPLPNGMLAVILHAQSAAQAIGKRLHKGINRAIATALQRYGLALPLQAALQFDQAFFLLHGVLQAVVVGHV